MAEEHHEVIVEEPAVQKREKPQGPKEFQLPSTKLLSFYVRQEDWKPTRPRGPVGAMNSGPGPAIVKLPDTIGETRHDPTKSKAPGYKMGARLAEGRLTMGPGPAAYNIRGWTNKGIDRCPAPKIGTRIPPLSGYVTPGPADHSRSSGDEHVYKSAPCWSMRSKTASMRLSSTPAPNLYTLPAVVGNLGYTPYANRAPGYTMRPRLSDLSTKMSPGPANYSLPSPNVYKPAAPSYSVPKATRALGASAGPGPLAHHAELVTYNKFSTPKCTFGIKHSPFQAFPEFAAEK